MKKLISIVTAASVALLPVLGISVSAGSGASYGSVPATDESIAIDGSKDEIYDYGLLIDNIDIIHNDTQQATGTSAKAWLLWDGDDTLYAYVEVKDSVIIEYEGEPDPWLTDSVELFLDYSNSNARTRDQYRIDFAGRGSYFDTQSYFGDDMKQFGFENWAAVLTDDGYAVEFEISAYNEPMEGDIGFHIMLNDMYDETNQSNFHSADCKLDVPSFGYITMSDEVVSLPEPETVSESDTDTEGSSAPQTFDLGITAAAIMMAASAAAIVAVKKKH